MSGVGQWAGLASAALGDAARVAAMGLGPAGAAYAKTLARAARDAREAIDQLPSATQRALLAYGLGSAASPEVGRVRLWAGGGLPVGAPRFRTYTLHRHADGRPGFECLPDVVAARDELAGGVR